MARRDVAIVGTAQRPNEVGTMLTSVELILPVINDVIAKVGIERREIGFWCHGSCDYMSGQPFSFVAAVDAIGAWPPIIESHVEGDGALALYEAWVKIQTGECDVALVFSNGKTTSGPIDRILNLQADPYMVTPLWPGFDSLAALQARACLDAGIMSEADMAEVAARSYRDAMNNPVAYAKENVTAAQLLDRPYTTAPLRAHDCGVPVDGANAIIMAAGVGNDRIDIAELHAPYTHQEILLRRAMNLGEGTHINPSGGALVSNPAMAAGLARFAEAAESVFSGSADRVLAHCTSGPMLQQNLVCVMEGE